MKEIIETKNAPGALGPYSQAVKIDNFVFTAGQIPLNPQTGELVETNIQDATHQAIKNLGAVLEAAGFSLNDVVKTMVFLKNMDDFANMNEVYAQYFNESKPARSTVQAAKLPKDCLVEIEAVACK